LQAETEKKKWERGEEKKRGKEKWSKGKMGGLNQQTGRGGLRETPT